MCCVKRALLALAVVAGALPLCGGCSSRPATIAPVDVDPDEASRLALEQYDKDDDGLLRDSELAAVPGIAKYKKLYDQDADGAVSAEEIAARLELWSEQGLGFRPLNLVLTVDGRPLPGATVTFVPEPYLGPNVKRAAGTTDASGMASMSVAVEDMPADLKDLPIEGVMGGTFKVEVTHPTAKLPARFNTETTLGEEVAFDTIRERATVSISTK
ncbi:MAG: hypothetical protein DCC67_20970 [Planctomycetota bacterium]|nr:MAG: hypothetical protein DCC67_20970 [Planctomycetota bacterium]